MASILEKESRETTANRTISTNPTMHLFHIPQCTNQNRNVCISALICALWDMEQVHYGICDIVSIDFMEIEMNWRKIHEIEPEYNPQSDEIRCTNPLTHRDRVTYIHVSKITIIGSDNALSKQRMYLILYYDALNLQQNETGSCPMPQYICQITNWALMHQN